MATEEKANMSKTYEADPESLRATSSPELVGDSMEAVGTKRQIKSRHAQMIAIGGSIGTNLFIGLGQVLAIGGPGLTLLAFCLMAIMVFGIVTAITEVGCFVPHPGNSMNNLTSRFLSKSLGFALGWLYVYSFGMIVAYEFSAMVIIIDYWPNDIHPAVWVVVGFVFFMAINLLPVGVYGETEFWFALLKVVMATGLLLLALILMLGGGPTGERLGYRYWNDPGAVNAYLVPGAGGKATSFLYAWVFSGFSFYFAPEQLILASGEMINPRKNLPTAARRFFFRLVFFYVLGAAAVGCICPSNAPGLTSGAGNANASPWVIAIKTAQIDILPSVINAGILTAAMSAGVAYLFMASRSLFALSLIGQAPKVMSKCNRWGVPYVALVSVSSLGLLGFLVVNAEAGQVFNWFISITNTAGYTSWIVCCALYLRFRKATEVKGITVPYRSFMQPYASWACLVVFSFLLLANGFTNFYPGNFSVSGFITTYIGIPLFLALWLGHKLIVGRNDPWLNSIEEMDMITGVREAEDDAERWTAAEEELKGANKGSWIGKIRVLWG
jgi:amino acid transporter